jgi:uncharacterized protein (DUF4415 family)
MPKLKPDHLSPTDAEEEAIRAGIAADPDTFEPTDEEFRRLRPAGRGRPPLPDAKRAVKLRIDPDVLDWFRATGPGWQTRMNEALRRAAGL